MLKRIIVAAAMLALPVMASADNIAAVSAVKTISVTTWPTLEAEDNESLKWAVAAAAKATVFDFKELGALQYNLRVCEAYHKEGGSKTYYAIGDLYETLTRNKLALDKTDAFYEGRYSEYLRRGGLMEVGYSAPENEQEEALSKIERNFCLDAVIKWPDFFEMK